MVTKPFGAFTLEYTVPIPMIKSMLGPHSIIFNF